MVGVGTGGTICGVAKYLKEKKPSVKAWGIDTYGSVFKKYKETGIFDKNEIYPYITEGIGEDFLPQNVDFSLIDHFEKVTDRDAAIMTGRIAREEGIFAGNSAGSAMAGLVQLADRFKKGETVVVIFHDHGTRYLGKMYNPDWMREKGFLDRKGLTARDLVANREKAPLVTIDRNETVEKAAHILTENAYSQIPVTADGRLVGTVNESYLYSEIVKNPDVLHGPVEAIMQPALPFADISTSVDALAAMLTPDSPAVLVRDFKLDATYIITRWDIIKALSYVGSTGSTGSRVCNRLTDSSRTLGLRPQPQQRARRKCRRRRCTRTSPSEVGCRRPAARRSDTAQTRRCPRRRDTRIRCRRRALRSEIAPTDIPARCPTRRTRRSRSARRRAAACRWCSENR